MPALAEIPPRMTLRAVLLDQRGGGWATGTGLIAIGLIDRDLAMHASAEDAEAAALALADERGLMAVRT